jgi:hypothetical protein
MNTFTDEDIEATFRKIRADFEERGNKDGLTMLDSFEEGSAIYGRLTDRQITWLERQLDGSWRRTEEPAVKDDADSGEPRRPNRRAMESSSRVPRGQMSDAAIRRRLRQQGKVPVDLERLEEIEAVMDELSRAIQLAR